MSSATPSRPIPAATDLHGLAISCLRRLLAGVQAVAFWTAALLPLLVLTALVSGAASQHPSLVAGALVLNAVCAVAGHNHSPER